MMKIYIIYLALCWVAQASYINRVSPIKRMTTLNRVRSPTVAFRPGVSLQGLQSLNSPWSYGSMRLSQPSSHRAPYVMYRSQPPRYTVKHYAPSSTRNVFAYSPWKTTSRLPPMSVLTPEYQFVKPAANAQTGVHNDGGTGAIHTIPAPNLSLSEKPIVVIEASENPKSEQAKPSYEVTEKYAENENNIAKIQTPSGFSKEPSFSPELQSLIRNGAALQVAAEYSLPAISVNRHHHITPQQFQMQGFNNFPSHQIMNNGAESIFMPQNAFYQSDPIFIQKLQNQLMHRFPAVEYIPYAADVPNHIQLQPQQHATEQHPQIVLLQNEQIDRPISIQVAENSEEKNLVQRDTQEASAVTILPQAFIVTNNTTEKQMEVTTPQQPQNLTIELVAAESRPVTTTIKYIIDTNTEGQNTTPIYYAQVGQNVGNVIANGFYSAINDVRAAAAMAQMDIASETTPVKPIQNVTTTTTTTTTLTPDLKAYFVENKDKSENNTKPELKSLLGAPFKKATESVNVAYTLVRADDKQPKLPQEGTVYAGQIVEATISEDKDFNKQKANLVSRRAPIRLFAVADSRNIASAIKSASVPEVAVIKAKIPPKSKLAFDEKTGEPILRIYASYSDSTTQRNAVVAKLATRNPVKETVIKRDVAESWKGSTVKTADKSHGFEANQVTQFGLKLKQRSDDYIPLFEDYED